MLPSARKRGSALVVALLVPVLLGCNEGNPTGFEELEVHLVEPFTLWWPGQESGEPLVLGSGRARFSAAANTRVYWKMRITAEPANPEDPRFAYAEGLAPPADSYAGPGFQDRISFGWSGSALPGRWPFRAGDVCTAILRYGPLPRLEDETVRVTQIRFVIGGGLLPDEDEPSTP